MVKNVVVLPAAIDDITEARDWYEARRAGLGDEFRQHVERCIDTIQRNPELFARVHKHYRRALVRRFPYAVFYESVDDVVVVYTVIHCSRDTETWQRRLP
jgi:plasmid stabilization system protein ParE